MLTGQNRARISWRHALSVGLLLGMSGIGGALADSSTGSQRAALGWSEISTPTHGPAQAIGGYARGCQSGAVELPLRGVGYQVLRPQRLRYYGQPSLIAFVKSLSEHMASQGHGDLMIGDLSQPRGGPMSYGHSSHQSGLDVDIWLQFASGPLSAEDLNEPKAVSMVATGDERVDPSRWTQAHEDLIRLAAQHPTVARIFVNPAIKASLCEKTHNAAWLQVLRPWKGHDEHIHVRLKCPEGNPLCEDQDAPPAGTGCGDDLMAWFRPPAPKPAAVPSPETALSALLAPLRPSPPPAPKKMPEACQTVLSGKGSIIPAQASSGQ